MTAVPFDTLRLSKRLEAAGFTADQADQTAEALVEAMSGADLATKADLELLRNATKSDIELLRRDLTIRVGGMFVVAVGILLAAMQLTL